LDPVAGTAVVIAVGGLRIIVTARRKPYHLESDFIALGLRPRGADLVMVRIGYLEPACTSHTFFFSSATVNPPRRPHPDPRVQRHVVEGRADPRSRNTSRAAAMMRRRLSSASLRSRGRAGRSGSV
jgi:hypothetical protein